MKIVKNYQNFPIFAHVLIQVFHVHGIEYMSENHTIYCMADPKAWALDNYLTFPNDECRPILVTFSPDGFSMKSRC